MNALTFLQYSTAAEALVVIIFGMYILTFKPTNMEAYCRFAGAISPFLLAQITCAFAASHVKKYLSDRKDMAKIKNGHVK